MYEIEFTDRAKGDLKWFRKRDQNEIADAIYEQLRFQPTVETRNRKRLRDLAISEWELRVDKARVFYDVEEIVRIVAIQAIGEKRGNKVFFRGRESEL